MFGFLRTVETYFHLIFSEMFLLSHLGYERILLIVALIVEAIIFKKSFLSIGLETPKYYFNFLPLITSMFSKFYPHIILWVLHNVFCANQDMSIAVGGSYIIQ